MAQKTKKSGIISEKNIALLIKRSPVAVPVFLVLIFVVFLVWPAMSKFFLLSQTIDRMQNDITTAERSNIDVATMKKDLEVFRKKVAEFENRLPKRMETTLIIDTLKEITEKSRLKFSSLEPLPLKKYRIEGTSNTFVELPIHVKLNCGYYDLVDFLKKIETADQLMRISDLNMRSSATSDWEHTIEFSISAYSQGDSND